MFIPWRTGCILPVDSKGSIGCPFGAQRLHVHAQCLLENMVVASPQIRGLRAANVALATWAMAARSCFP